MKNLEHQQQVALFQWASLAKGQMPGLELLLAIPNGGKRNIITAMNMKREGVKAGVPDVFLPVPRGRFHGLFIEMKIKGGKMSEAQLWWARELVAHGYAHHVCFDWIEAKNIITDYLDYEKRK